MALARRVPALAAAAALLTTSAASATGTIAFAPAVHFPTGSSNGPGPGAVTTVAADLDGDGDVDVVVTDWFGDGPLVLLNDDGGRFGAPSAIPGASQAGALATADLDGDGPPDLVARGGNEVVVLLGNGDGTFRVSHEAAVPRASQDAVAVLDADGDGVPDIAAPTRLGIQLLTGRGDGTFTDGPMSPLSGLLSDVRPANLDGDEIADLVAADATPLTQRIVALRGNGDGSFSESGSGAVAYGPEAVMAGDLDSDGHDDAVSVDSFSRLGSPEAFVITVLPGDGRGGFGVSTAYPTGDGPVSGAMGDLDGDGNLDVVVSSVGDGLVTVYQGDGTGALVEVGRFDATGFPQTPAAADVDGDGRPDLVVPGPGQFAVLRNTGGPRPPASDAAPGSAAPPPTVAGEAGGQTLPASGSERSWTAVGLTVLGLALGMTSVLRRQGPMPPPST